jgi:hypothetical protein
MNTARLRGTFSFRLLRATMGMMRHDNSRSYLARYSVAARDHRRKSHQIGWTMNRRVSLRGLSTDAPVMRGVTKYYDPRNSIQLPSGSIASPIGALKTFNLSQAVLDGLVVVGGLVALVIVFGSLPLAVGLMIFGVL